MLQDILNKKSISEEVYSLDFDFAEVTSLQINNLVTCKLLQQIRIYEDCLLLGEFYSPTVGDKGVLFFVGKQKYPCFYAFVSGASTGSSSDITLKSQSESFTANFSISKDFISKVEEIAKEVGIQPAWLLVLMYFESELDPSRVNSKSGATGLIQWLDPRPAEIGTTIQALKQMSALEQLEFVKKDFIRAKGRLKSIYDTMMWVFHPAYVGKSPDTLFPQNVISSNSGISSPRDYTKRALDKAKNFIIYDNGSVTIKSNGSIILEK